MVTNWNAHLVSAIGHTPKLCLLDLDGTLIDSVPDIAKALDASLKELGLSPIGVDKTASFVGNGSDLLMQRALAWVNHQALEEVNQHQQKQLRQAFNHHYLEALQTPHVPFSGVDEWFKQVDIPKVLITNKPRMFTEPLLAGLGWQGHFQQVLCADDLSEKKPSPQPLLFACKKQNISPSQAVMIGDSKNDIKAAKAAGVFSVAVSYGYNHDEPISVSQPDWLVDDLFELLD